DGGQDRGAAGEGHRGPCPPRRVAPRQGRRPRRGGRPGLEPALIDRLTLDEKGIESMAAGLEQVAALPDPVGEMTDIKRRPSGIALGKMRVPLGVIGIIYEARPNATADAAATCLKSGNAAILRGGKEAYNANRAIPACVR